MGETLDAARFAQGLTWDAYKAQMTRNRDRLDASEAKVVINTDDLKFFKSLKPLHVLSIVEDWCGDVLANAPVLATLAKQCGTLDVRHFLKDQSIDLTEQYLNHGRFESIPIWVFFDEKWKELGVFIERPLAVTERREEDRRAVYAGNPAFGSPGDPADKLPDDVRGTLMAALQKARADGKPWADRQVVMTLRDILARAPQQGERERDSGNH